MFCCCTCDNSFSQQFQATISQQWLMLARAGHFTTTDNRHKSTVTNAGQSWSLHHDWQPTQVNISCMQTTFHATVAYQCFINDGLHAVEPCTQWRNHVVKSHHSIVDTAAVSGYHVKPRNDSQLALLSWLEATAEVSYMLQHSQYRSQTHANVQSTDCQPHSNLNFSPDTVTVQSISDFGIHISLLVAVGSLA